MRIAIAVVCMAILAGCMAEYGDVHGTAENFDVKMGLKARPTEIVALRRGSIQFTGCFVFVFPEATMDFFDSPPSDFFLHPKLMSYERDKTLIRWRKTPFQPEHRHFFEKSIELAESIGLKEEHVSALTKLVAATNGLYAISYEDDGSQRSHNVELLIIDPQTRRFYQFVDTNGVFKPNQAPHGTAGGRADASPSVP